MNTQPLNTDLLIVDDDPVVLMILEKMILKSYFHPRPVVFQTGYEMLHYLKERSNIDHDYLIMLDINMPDISGWEVMDDLLIHGGKEKFKVVIVTSSINKADRKKAQNYPCVIEYLEKPVFLDRLMHLKELEQLKGAFGSA